MKRFAGRAAIVTGGDSGIGLAVAHRLAAEGARVVVAARNPNKIDAAVASLFDAGGEGAWGTVCDVSNPDQVEAVCSETVKRHGRLDVIVNSAGVMSFKPLAELTVRDWNSVLAVDLLGAFNFIREALRTMSSGSVVNVASIHACATTPLVAPYAAAKAALLSLTRSAALEGQPKSIRVNAILPGAIDTDMLWDNPNVRSGAEKIEPADVGQPENIAAAAAYLASDDAAFVTGVALPVDGGRLARL